jgi:hypothetical protein
MIAMRLLFALPLALGGCGGGSDDPAGNTASTDAGIAPQPMNEEAALIENEALAPLPEPPANMTDDDAALPGITAPPVAPRPQPTATQAPDQGRETASRLVRAYYDRIARGDYAGARAMWDDGGAASGLTAEQFAERFGRYTDMQVEVGMAGRIDGGAGQRYVEVPVRVSGRAKDGGDAIDRQGVVTLHRTGDIEGATPQQQQWRIAAAEILPNATEAAPAIATARYQCANGTQLIARFDKAAGTMSLRRGYQRFEPLQQQQSGSGIWYRGEGGELRGKGDAATITLPGEAATECKSR